MHRSDSETLTAPEETEHGAAELVAAMPKAELHVHLDGCLRLTTIADLIRHEGLPFPTDLEELRRLCVAPDQVESLTQFLALYTIPVSVLQTAESLERVTYELCEDMRRENVRYAEIRFGPALHRERGLQLPEIIGAVVRGWQAGHAEFGLRGGIILCAMREMSPEMNMEVARAGLPFLGNGVVGFDLAGDEAAYPVLLHRQPLLFAKEAGYGMTVHAGEGAGAQSVRDTIEGIGVSRIGHGVRSAEDPMLLQVLRDRHVTLEMCPTSNVQVHAVPSITEHPLFRFYRDGIRVTINTDGRTPSNTSMTKELTVGLEKLSFRVRDLAAVTLTAVEAGFADREERRALLAQMAQEITSLGITLPPT